MRKSFTLIELLVVISIISIFSTIGLAYYNNYNQQIKLRSDVKKLVDVIELAKKKAFSGDLYQSCADFSGYRVTINGDSYSFSFGCLGSYQTVQSYNFSSNVTAIIGTDDFDFRPLGQGTNLTTNSIRLKNSVINQCLDISVSSIGVIDVNETLITCP